MKHGHRLLTAGLMSALFAVALVLVASGGQPSLAEDGIIYVDAGAPGTAHDGTSWATAFTELQTALDTAIAEDEIWVAAGVYTPTWQFDPEDPRSATFQMVDGVAIYGGFAAIETERGQRDWVANPTVLSGDLNGDDGPDFANNDENSYHVFYHPDGTDLDNTAVLDGFTITGGNANHVDTLQKLGGGMYNYASSPSLTNCTFEYNSADGSAGGMYNYASPPVLTNCTFEGNSATNGGGMYNGLSSPTLTNCTFWSNQAIYGGGVFNFYSSPTLTNCTFSQNYASGTESWQGRGGGIYNNESSPALTNCTFDGNSAEYGGGMYNYINSAPTLTNCTFAGNSAEYGGGMGNYHSSSPTLTNCTITGNSADYGGGVSNDFSSPTLINCILWGNTPEGVHHHDATSSTTITYSDVQGGCDADPLNVCGDGNIDADPLFVDPDNGDVHLGPGSPCIDAGINSAPDLPPYDFEGDTRIVDGDRDGDPVVDMGVDEVLLRAYLPLILSIY